MTHLPVLGYSRPTTLNQALAALRRPGACIYAGGTDLLVALQHREPWTAWVRELVDIKDLETAHGITEETDGLRIGALVTAAQLATSTHVRRRVPALAESAAATSAPLLRARGTVGGNLVTPHPAGDVATALLALDASVELVGSRGGVRCVPIERLLSAPALTANGRQLILAVHVRTRAASAFEKLAHRHVFARSLLAVAVAYTSTSVRVALGGVSERPVLVRLNAEAVAGKRLEQALVKGSEAFHALEPTLSAIAISLVRRTAARAL